VRIWVYGGRLPGVDVRPSSGSLRARKQKEGSNQISLFDILGDFREKQTMEADCEFHRGPAVAQLKCCLPGNHGVSPRFWEEMEYKARPKTHLIFKILKLFQTCPAVAEASPTRTGERVARTWSGLAPSTPRPRGIAKGLQTTA